MSSEHPAYLSLVLHAHLPMVRHPEVDRCLEEVWFFEAMTECYLPLLEMFERLEVEGIRPGVTFSLSPPLLHMMTDEIMRARYLEHLQRLIALARRECQRLKGDEALLPLAEGYLERFEQLRTRYRDTYNGDVISVFDRLERAGVIQLMTSAGTHAFLPLYQHQPELIQAQIRAGLETFERIFERPVSSFWIPECGYFQGLDEVLCDAGVTTAVVDTHAITGAQPPSAQQCYAPMRSPAGLAFFGRDPQASRQVWSSREGYPGDYDYREYYSDIGFTLPEHALEGYLLPDGTRIPTGIKYQRVSGGNAEKEPYDPARAGIKLDMHARHFVKSRLQRAEAGPHGKAPLLMVAPYDAELFGHWWHEGPLWLESVIRRVDSEASLQCIGLESYRKQFQDEISSGNPAASSWGQAGFNQYWLNYDTSWIYPQVHEAGERLLAMLRKSTPGEDALQERARMQMARTLFLAQASDWAFIMRSGTTTDYAVRRIQEALARFRYLEEAASSQSLDARKLAGLEILDDIFPDMHRGWFTHS